MTTKQRRKTNEAKRKIAAEKQKPKSPERQAERCLSRQSRLDDYNARANAQLARQFRGQEPPLPSAKSRGRKLRTDPAAVHLALLALRLRLGKR